MSPRPSSLDLKSLSTGRAGRLPIVGGRPCLDFLNTTSGRGTTDRREHLHTYGDLLAWTHHAGLLSAEDTLALARLARGKPAGARRMLAQAVTLRETLHVVFEATVHRREVPADAVVRLNRFIAGTAKVTQLAPTKGLLWRWSSESRRLGRPLWPIIRCAADLLTAGPLNRVKMCSGQACGWMFLDETRNGRRRWCEMQVCGSRAKMHRFRQRHGASQI
ncbi:MAG TPA: ABATE domain-containing protein [Dongiaceae bacterium]|nr:ABATE domain-containing protein [Dongiaceae bacterium]